MSRPVKPISPVSRARRLKRRPQAVVPAETGEDPAPAKAAAGGERPPTPQKPVAEAAVAAQLLGEGERRGLRAGQQVRVQARSTYLENEFAGRRDRRARKGRITKTEI